MRVHLSLTLALLCGGALAHAQPDTTAFQAGAPYDPSIDIQTDMAIVYGNQNFAERVAAWREQGYTAAFMTGISWGRYSEYYGGVDNLKVEEIQTNRRGRVYMHGNSKTVGYNVPTPAYVEFIKEYVNPAIDAGVRAVFMEEPEYWARTGYSEAFKEAWQTHYGEPWVAPHTCVTAQWKASLLKYQLYYDALREVFDHVKQRGAEQGFDIACHVPTHSLINYAHWRIVNPMSRLMDLENCDGYIAQVWTGTARTPNHYRGELRERTFETAFFEYGQMLGMVRPSGRRVWFLHDPIEDNPNHTWADYKVNYEATVVASLLWPEVHDFEVMPWPNRIFNGDYPTGDGDRRAGIPPEYATQVLTIANALADMDQPDVEYDTGSEGLGILVSDSLMFQRAEPDPSDEHFGSFYGLALPLLKRGVPLAPVQLEQVTLPNNLDPYRLLLLTFEGQKPLKREHLDALADWVRDGGLLLYVGDGTDPYHTVPAWWNDDGATSRRADEALFDVLGLEERPAARTISALGEGAVYWLDESPAALSEDPEGDQVVAREIDALLAHAESTLATQHYLHIRRGPYHVVAVLDETETAETFTLPGRYVDLFDAALPVRIDPTFRPGQRALLRALPAPENAPGVLAAGARVREFAHQADTLSFVLRGPARTTAALRVHLPRPPREIMAGAETLSGYTWDAASRTLFFSVANQAEAVEVQIALAPVESGV